MLSATIAIHWHDEGHPVYSLDFQSSESQSRRLATAGGDNNVRIWNIRYPDGGEPQETSVEYLSTLRKHSQAVNAVRFDPSGQLLASAGDDGMLIIWTLADTIVHEFGTQEDDMTESWVVNQIHNTNSEIYDICWSPDSNFIATGSMDNTTKIFNIVEGHKVIEIPNHTHYVQGIAWDPLNEFLATQSADRSVSIHSLSIKQNGPHLTLSANLYSKSIRGEVPVSKLQNRSATNQFKDLTNAEVEDENKETSSLKEPADSAIASQVEDLQPLRIGRTQTGSPVLTKLSHFYHSENLQSFFRRLAFSPDGSLLVAPSGVYKNENVIEKKEESVIESASLNTVYIYTRAGLNRSPICHLPGLSKPAIAVSFSPRKYALSSDGEIPVFALPYKLIFAVATPDSIIIYDTEKLQPLGLSSNLHYLSITDLCWDQDGLSLMISSAEGFCSVITFNKSDFGLAFQDKKNTPKHRAESPLHATATGKNFDDATRQTIVSKGASQPKACANLDHAQAEVTLDSIRSCKAVESPVKSTHQNLSKKSIFFATNSSDTPKRKRAESAAVPYSDGKSTLNTHFTEGIPDRTRESKHGIVGSRSPLHQFIASPILVHNGSLVAPETVTETDIPGASKKKRITPTLVSER